MTAYFLITPFDHHCRSSFCSIKGDQSPKPPVEISAIGYQRTTTTIKILKSWSYCVYLHLESFELATCRKKPEDFDLTNLNAKPLVEVCVQENLRNHNVKSKWTKPSVFRSYFLPCMMNKACLYWSWSLQWGQDFLWSWQESYLCS